LALLYGCKDTSMLVNVVNHPNKSRVSKLHGKDHWRGILRFHGHRGGGGEESMHTSLCRESYGYGKLARYLAKGSCRAKGHVRRNWLPFPHTHLSSLIFSLCPSLSSISFLPRPLPRSPATSRKQPRTRTWRVDRNLGAGLANWKIMPTHIFDVFLAKMRDNGISR